jgi:hypothetical protein
MTDKELEKFYQCLEKIERKLDFQNEERIKRLEEELKEKAQNAWDRYCEARVNNNERDADVYSGEYIGLSDALGALYHYYLWLVDDAEEEGEE